MIYSLNLDIYEKNSGIEHSAIERHRLFDLNKIESKILTSSYNRFLNRNLTKFNLDYTKVLNMYDYFQRVVKLSRVEQKVGTLADIDLKKHHLVAHGPSYFTVEKNGSIKNKVTVMPNTVGLVDKNIFYDAFGKITRVDNYDWRGFKSSSEFFGIQEELILRRYFDANGKLKIETKYNDDKVSAIYLIDENKYFDSEKELFEFFLKQITKPVDILISDRRNLDETMFLQSVNKKIFVNHGLQTPEIDALENNSDSYPIYDVIRNPLEQWKNEINSVVVQTSLQQADLTKIANRYFGGAKSIQVAADTFVDTKRAETNRENKIIFAGYITENRRLDLSIDIFKSVKMQIPDAIFEIYGYFENTEIENKIRDLIKDIPDIKLMDYVLEAELLDNYKTAKVFLQVSKSDAFGSPMIHSMSVGTPVISTDSLYGPREIIDENYRTNDINQIVSKIVSIMQNHAEFETAQNIALKTAQKFNSENLLKQWQAIFK